MNFTPSYLLALLAFAPCATAAPGAETGAASARGYLREVPPEPEGARNERLRRIAERRAGPIVMVHRGASAFAPENTLEAYAAALDHGADGCEVDLRRTADGVLVLFHDDMLDHLTDGFGTVRQVTYFELLSLRPRFLYGTADDTTRPPTFAALLTLARERAMLLHLDIKEPDLEDDIARLLEAAGVWDHVVACNADNAPRLVKDPRLRLLRYKAPGLFETRLDMDPAGVKAALARPGEMIIVDDPRVAALELKRTLRAPMALPDSLREDWKRTAPPAADSAHFIPSRHLETLAAQDSPAGLMAILERDDPERMQPAEDPRQERKRAERTLERAWAAQRIGQIGTRSARIVELLELQVKNRSLHRDWMFHGLDGAMAARALGMLRAVESAPLLVEQFRRVDPALAKVANPEWARNPLSWTDFRAKMYTIAALGELRCKESKEFLLEYLALDVEQARQLAPLLQEDATRALFRHALTSGEIEVLLRSSSPAVRGTALLECVDHPSPERAAALGKAAPWALELVRG